MATAIKNRGNTENLRGKGNAGRPKGAVNKLPALLKDAIVEAASLEGGKEGLIGYLRKVARTNKGAYASLLGRVLPLQIQGDKDNPLRTITEVRETIVDPNNS
jgi:hypothetical protein